ncbi:hypothetical protein [Flavobacterium sp. HNIBRBA15423]|uniref:hypothetical protein n=1 Tax=Flavobacterium sp. HNIBRBA15423 TaxID=3458683 RepID=UPI004044844D
MKAQENKTFRNLLVLQQTREAVKIQLKEKYTETVTPFIDIIIQVMKANDINEFDAIQKIKSELSIYKKPGSELLFSTALIEIVEGKHFE